MMKTTTKFLGALGLTLALGTTAFAQKQCDLKFEISASTATVNFGDTVRFSPKITNLSTTAFTTTDTAYYGVIGATNVFRLLVTNNLNQNQSETFTNDIYIRHAMDTLTADRTMDFCFKLYPQSAITVNSVPVTITYIDPVANNDSACVTVTFKKKPTNSVLNLNNKNEQLNFYPNPATADVNFALSLEKAENVIVSVKDITGREVMRNDFGKVQAGQAPFKINVANLNNGIYFIELNAGERKAVGKMNVRH